MAPSKVAVQDTPTAPLTHRIVNDFSIRVATINGSGSQTANLVLLRSIFQMGVPVSGKNLFPSNIAGLPTPGGVHRRCLGNGHQRRSHPGR